MYGETVIRLRSTPAGEDRYGNDDVVTEETEIPGAGFDPGGSVEPVEVGRSSVVTTPKLYFYESTPDITRADRLRVRGVEYDVASEPAEWRNPFTGWAAGLVVELARTGG